MACSSRAIMKSTMVAALICFISLGLVLPIAEGWTATSPTASKCRSFSNAAATTALFNVPPPSVDDVKAFKEYSNRQPPPASFFDLQQD